MKLRYRQLLCALGVMMVSSACLTTPLPTPVPAPPLPSELTSLPREGQIICSEGEVARGNVVTLWELPGTTPLDPDSALMGNRGTPLGYVAHCDIVTLAEVRWSPWDAEYYVYVITPYAEGWLTADMLNLVLLQAIP